QEVVPLGVDAPAAAVLAVAGPSNHEVAQAVHRHGRIGLVARGGGVDLERAALHGAAAVEALGVDAPAAAVLALAGPGDHVVARQVAGHGLVVAGSRLLDGVVGHACGRFISDRNGLTAAGAGRSAVGRLRVLQGHGRVGSCA